MQGEKLKVSLEDLKKGYMQQVDYTKKTAELAKQRKQLEATSSTLEEHKQEISHFFGQLQDSSKVLPVLKSVSPAIRKAVSQAVEQEAAQMLHELTLSEEEQAAKRRARQQAEFEEDQRRLQADRQALEQEEQQKLWAQRIEAWVPKALESVGLPNTDRVRRLIGQEILPLLESNRSSQYTDFEEAAQAVAEEWPELLEKREEKEKKEQKPKHPPSAPKRSSGGRPRSEKRKSVKKERIRSSDFFSDLILGRN